MDPNQLLQQCADVVNSLTPEERQGLFMPSIKTMGYTLDGIITLICYPLLKSRIYLKGKLENYKDEVNNRVTKIPEQFRDEKLYPLVLKAIEESKYQINEDDIRKMYVNLIASTVDSRKNGSITPRFATVISQFGKQDAQFLDILYSQQNQQLIYGYRRAVSKDNSGVTITNRLFKLDNGDLISSFDLSVDTLSSLGVIKELEKDELASSHYRQEYHSIENDLRDSRYIKSEFISAENISSDTVRGHIMLTEFGKRLCQCIFEPALNVSDPVLIDDAIEATGSMSTHQVPTAKFDDSTNSSTPN